MRKILLSVLGICACTTLSLHADYDEEEAIAPRSTPPARTKIDTPHGNLTRQQQQNVDVALKKSNTMTPVEAGRYFKSIPDPKVRQAAINAYNKQHGTDLGGK